MAVVASSPSLLVFPPVWALPGRDRHGLTAVASEARRRADALGQPVLASVTLEVGELDPLAVLDAIDEPGQPYFYAEHPQRAEAVAGGEAAWQANFAGPDRFVLAAGWSRRVAQHAVVATVGTFAPGEAGPLFLGAFTFADTQPADAPFPAALVTIPRWQIALRAGRVLATANLAVEPGQDVQPGVNRIWAAHEKFTRFDYRPRPPAPAHRVVAEVAAPGRPYPEIVRLAVAEIGAGRCSKVVLARAVDLTAAVAYQPLACVGRLRERFSGCLAYAVATGQGSCLVGATPERLVRRQGAELFTEALAGSAPRDLANLGADAAMGQALLASDKDQREHRLVVESIARRLASLGVVARPAPRAQLLRLPNVQHLRTPITAQVPPDLHLLEAAAVLHPTPAVGGVPREPALSLIAELEGFPRDLFAGTIGWWDLAGQGELAVALRCALVQGHQARLYAGAGIVAGSDPQRELRETELKLAALRPIFQGE